MRHSEQVALGQALFDHIDNGTTALADTGYKQPVTEYTCPTVAEREMNSLFRRRPICVGLSPLLPEPGTFSTHDLSGQPLILTRSNDGEFRAFLNVCRHRGVRVAEGSGKKPTFVCPFHAWSYGLDGTLLGRPEDQDFDVAPKCDHGLTSVPAIEKDGFLWVIPNANATPDFNSVLSDFPTDLADFGFQNFHHYKSCKLDLNMNWKILMDTFMESYHFKVLHKNSLVPIMHTNLNSFDTSGVNMRMCVPRLTIEELRDRHKESWDILPHVIAVYTLFPNVVLIWQLDHVEFWQIFPDQKTPEKSSAFLSLYVPELAQTESACRHWDNNLNFVLEVVENEDFPVGEAAQKGLLSGAQDYLVFGRNEPALAHFHRTLTATISGEQVASNYGRKVA